MSAGHHAPAALVSQKVVASWVTLSDRPRQRLAASIQSS